MIGSLKAEGEFNQYFLQHLQKGPLSDFLSAVIDPWRIFNSDYSAGNSLPQVYADCETAFAKAAERVRDLSGGSERLKQAGTRLNEYLIIMMLCNLPALESAEQLISGEKLTSLLENTIFLVVDMVDDRTLGTHPNEALIGLYDQTPTQDVAISHVWGYPMLVAPSETGTARSRFTTAHSFPEEATCSSWMIGERLVQKFLAFLGDRVWMDAFCVPQCCKAHKGPYVETMFKHYVSSRATVAVSEMSKVPSTPRDAFVKLVEEGWFKRAWTVQELGLARDVFIVYAPQNDPDRLHGGELTNVRMFDVIHELLLESVGYSNIGLGKANSELPITREDIFWTAYSYRAIRASVFDLDPAQNVTALMQGRSAHYPVDVVFALANLCGVQMKADYSKYEQLSEELQIAEAWMDFAKAYAKQRGGMGLYVTSCVSMDVSGLGAVPNVGYDVQPIWPRGRRMRVTDASWRGLSIRSVVFDNLIPKGRPIQTEGINGSNSPADVKNFIENFINVNKYNPVVAAAEAYAPWVGNCIKDQQSKQQSRWMQQAYTPHMAAIVDAENLIIVLTASPVDDIGSLTPMLVLSDERSGLKVYTCALLKATEDHAFKMVGHLWLFSQRTLHGSEKDLTIA
ncbi:hypothetical protein BJ742DRAFT_272166 [Cladochytrium replicatum]|nr:hypothetical protein BJ742DRAFT_272166 [Cladochytrium replicatum]